MYLLYLDDSGSTENQDEEYLVLGGMAVFERQVHWLTRRLDNLATSLFPQIPPQNVEFHASEIFSGRELPWDSLRNKTERIGIMRQVLGVLAEAHDSVKAFAVAVHKRSFPTHEPMELAFENICSRFDLHLKRIYRQYPDRRHTGLVIFDKGSHETTLQSLALEYRARGTQWGVLHSLPEVPLFVDSSACRLIQLADHIAYAVFRRYNSGDSSYLDPILGRFDVDRGVLHGLVHKHNLQQACFCPACMSRRAPQVDGPETLKFTP
jgi:hypothetical protein